MLKICFIINNLSGGGAERVISLLSSNLSKKYEVSIILLMGSAKNQYNVPKTVKIYSIKNSKNKLIKYLCLPFKLYKKMSLIDSDIYISFCTIENLMAIFCNFILKKKIIISERNDPILGEKYKLLIFLKKIFYGYCDKIVFQTSDAQKAYRKSISLKGIVIANPINDNLPLYSKKDNFEKKVCAIGRLVPQKNYEFMIIAFKKIVEIDSMFKLYIFGEGLEKEKLNALIKQLDLKNNVFLMGFTKNVYDEILENDIYIMTSLYEGMPNSLMEAMAIGIPCICSDCPCGGPRQLINQYENGLLYECNNEEDFLFKFFQLANNEKLRETIKKNSILLRQEYSLERVTNLWDKLIIDVLHNYSNKI